MKINKCCRTCKWNFPSKNNYKIRECASVNYGEKILNFEEEKDCWEIGMDYWCELREKLTPEEKYKMDKNVYEDNDILLFKLIEQK